MANEEFEHLKHSSPKDDASPRHEADAQRAVERRKLDRDMDRLERVLTGLVKPNHQALVRRREEDRRWKEFEQASQKRFAEIRRVAARSDAKLKVLAEDLQRSRNERS